MAGRAAEALAVELDAGSPAVDGDPGGDARGSLDPHLVAAAHDADRQLAARLSHGHPKRIRAARDIENGGSLTIIATSLVDTGSVGDTVYFGDIGGWFYALDRATGVERWRTARPNQTRSYCPPVIFDLAGKKQMVLTGSKCVASYDPDTGKQLWIVDGPTEQFVASLVYLDGLLFLTAGFPEYHILAIRPDGTGNVTKTHIAWRDTRGAAYVPSPIAWDKYFFLVSDNAAFNYLYELVKDRGALAGMSLPSAVAHLAVSLLVGGPALALSLPLEAVASAAHGGAAVTYAARPA